MWLHSRIVGRGPFKKRLTVAKTLLLRFLQTSFPPSSEGNGPYSTTPLHKIILLIFFTLTALRKKKIIKKEQKKTICRTSGPHQHSKSYRFFSYRYFSKTSAKIGRKIMRKFEQTSNNIFFHKVFFVSAK